MAEYIYDYSIALKTITADNKFSDFNELKKQLKKGDIIKFNFNTGFPSCSISASTDFNSDPIQKCVFNFAGTKVKIVYNIQGRQEDFGPRALNFKLVINCLNEKITKSNFLFGSITSYYGTYGGSSSEDSDDPTMGRHSLSVLPSDNSLFNIYDRQIVATNGEGNSDFDENKSYYYANSLFALHKKQRYYDAGWRRSVVGGAGWYGGTGVEFGGGDARGKMGSGSAYILTNESEKYESYLPDWKYYVDNILSEQQLNTSFDSSIPEGCTIEVLDVFEGEPAKINYYINDVLYKSIDTKTGLSFNNIIPPLPSPIFQFAGWSDRDNNQILTENSIINKAVYNVNAIFIEYDNYHYFPYSGKMESMTLDPGSYKLIVAGAQGAKGANEFVSGGGFGGYSEGTLELKEPTKIFIYAGGQPDYNKSPGGFNGGGRAGYNDYTKSYYYPAGGGASDIRLGQDSLYARVIVAGGGGGNSDSYGGGLASNITYGDTKYQATQTGGYQFGVGRDAPSGGGSGYYGTESGPGAGGGGWYGGDHSNFTTNYGGAGNASGGSGYIYTAESAKNYPEGCLLNEKYYLKDAFMYDGSGTKESTKGNLGHGYAYVITNETGDFKISQINYYNDGVLYKTAYYKIGKTPKEVILPDKGILTGFNGWIDKDTGAKFNEKSPLEKEIYNLEAQYKESKGFEFSYTGKVQEQDLKPGIYKIKMYGAQGGNYDDKHQGGLGGYSEGTLELKEPTKIFVYVGGQPAKSTSYGQPGGFNGGGKSGYSYYSDKTYGQAGGGASDIRIGQDSLYARVIVAGGGAGGNNHQDHKLDFAGGGEVSKGYSGYTANQTSGYQFGVGQNGYNGGNYRYTSGGAGGGWYGGKSYQSYADSTRYDKYSAGGSGYVYTAETAKNYPSGCLLNEKYYLTEAQTVAGDINGREGNGSIAIIDLTPPSESLSVLNLYKNGAFKSTNANIYKTDKFQTCNVFKYINGEFKKI